jgi:hypothetical protein
MENDQDSGPEWAKIVGADSEKAVPQLDQNHLTEHGTANERRVKARHDA